MPNRLAAEKSPYLRSHAQNPVDWYPWGDEAFARARAEDKPIFLSVGYSTCHWCHVMERESFENDAIAQVMNQHFVSVKVDREERPDVDKVYMSFVQATTGGGGWPMSVFLTPALEPFFGGTYFPPDSRYGRPGFGDLLGRVAELWRDRRDSLVDAGKRVIAQLRDAERPGDAVALDAQVLERGAAFFAQAFDREHAGFGSAPKFPRPSTHNFLLRWSRLGGKGAESAEKMVVATLALMSRGGMYDHLGGGYHRYSVDRYWHVPHFEKMLYDQAQLVTSLVETWLVTREPELERVARETCDYVLRDLLQPGGGFASAEDADSEAPGAAHKLEGAFYVWTAAELREALGDDAAAIFGAYYAVEEDGNAEDPHGELTGKNVLHAVSTLDEVAKRFDRPRDEIGRLIDDARRTLLERRARRPRPGLDDKVLTAWNGLMIGALAQAGAAFGEARYLDAAAAAARFVEERMWDGARLMRRYRDGEVAIEAYLDDHAFLAWGLLELADARLEERWATWAERLAERMVALFWDEEGGGFFTTSGRDPSVLVRLKDDYDGAEPAGSSLAVLVLLRLAELADRPAWKTLAERTLASYSSRLAQAPHAMPQMLVALMASLRSPPQIVLAGERGDAGLAALLSELRRQFVPERVLVVADAATRERLARDGKSPWIAAMGPVDGRAAAYVCRDHACERPVTEPQALRELLAPRG